MTKLIRMFILFVFVKLTFTLFLKGLELWSLGTNVNGDGIWVHFLGLEIDDRVPEKIIPVYSICFFIASLLTLLITFILAPKTYFRRFG
ncbi:hypothetical protein RGU12_13765 [Fredinandcohnia sp. QZ13]|uniref:hypothetical protein n=1 Tax=Fredinandcohnia sp. QZ13 TaxID=3073144 RepID=UPI0028536251|nr:hypothetical protein [Fredinandcohnia sp. QZ13]MDR4888576.1 hypothetical protein [Fredinandcohnia sp. QZ13]